MPLASIALLATPAPAALRAKRLAGCLLCCGVFTLAACNYSNGSTGAPLGNGGGASQPPPAPMPLPAPSPAPASSAGPMTGAAEISRSPSRTLQLQDGSTTAGAQVSKSSRYTLINEGVSP